MGKGKKTLVLFLILQIFSLKGYSLFLSREYSFNNGIETIESVQPPPRDNGNLLKVVDELKNTSSLLSEEEFNQWLTTNLAEITRPAGIDNLYNYLKELETLNLKTKDLIQRIEKTLEDNSFESEFENEELKIFYDNLVSAKETLYTIQDRIKSQFKSISKGIDSHLEEIKSQAQLYLDLTDAELELLKIFSPEEIKGLENAVTERINQNIRYAQKLNSIFKLLNSDEHFQAMRNYLSEYINKLIYQKDKIDNIEEYPPVITYREETLEKLIQETGLILEDLNKFPNLSQEGKENFFKSIASFKTQLGELQLDDSILDKLDQIKETINMNLYQFLGENELNELFSLRDKFNNLVENLTQIQEWLPKFLKSIEIIEFGLGELISPNVSLEEAETITEDIRQKVVTEITEITVRLSEKNFIEKILHSLNPEMKLGKDFNSFLEELDQMLEIYRMLPANLKYAPVHTSDPDWTIQPTLFNYIESLIASENNKYLKAMDTLQLFVPLDPKFGEILNALKRYSDLISEKQTEFSGVGQPLGGLTYSETVLLDNFEKVIKGEMSLGEWIKDLLDQHSSRLGEIIEILTQISKSSNFDLETLNTISSNRFILEDAKEGLNYFLKSVLSNNQLENILSEAVALRNNPAFNEVFNYLDRQLEILKKSRDEIKNVISLIDAILEAQDLLLQANSTTAQLGQNRKESQRIKSELDKIEKNISFYQNLRSQLPPEDTERVNQKLQNLNSQKQELERKYLELKNQSQHLQREVDSLIQTAKNKVDSLKSFFNSSSNQSNYSHNGSNSKITSSAREERKVISYVPTAPGAPSPATTASAGEKSSDNQTQKEVNHPPNQDVPNSISTASLDNSDNYLTEKITSGVSFPSQERKEGNEPLHKVGEIQEMSSETEGSNQNETMTNLSKSIPTGDISKDSTKSSPMTYGVDYENKSSSKLSQGQSAYPETSFSNDDEKNPISNTPTLNKSKHGIKGNKTNKDSSDPKPEKDQLAIENKKDERTTLREEHKQIIKSTRDSEFVEKDSVEGSLNKKERETEKLLVPPNLIQSLKVFLSPNSIEKIGSSKLMARLLTKLFYLARTEKTSSNQKQIRKEVKNMLNKAHLEGTLNTKQELEKIIKNLNWEDVFVLRGKDILERMKRTIMRNFENSLKEDFGEDVKATLVGVIFDLAGNMTLLVFEITTVDGEKQLVIRSGENVLYIESKGAIGVIKAILKQILFGNKKISDRLMDRILLIIGVLSILAIAGGISLAIAYTRFQINTYSREEKAIFSSLKVKRAKKTIHTPSRAT